MAKKKKKKRNDHVIDFNESYANGEGIFDASVLQALKPAFAVVLIKVQ